MIFQKLAALVGYQPAPKKTVLRFTRGRESMRIAFERSVEIQDSQTEKDLLELFIPDGWNLAGKTESRGL